MTNWDALRGKVFSQYPKTLAYLASTERTERRECEMSNIEIIDPADVKPGQFAPVPTTEKALLIECLRFANRVSGLLGEIDRNVLNRIKDDDDKSFDDLHDLLLRRFSDCSGLHLFIAANNVGVDLPADLRYEADDAEGYED